MDENKELFTSQADEEVKPDADTDTEPKENNEQDYGDTFDGNNSSDSYNLDDFDEHLTQETEDGLQENEKVIKGKKRLIQVPVIISIAIVAVTLLALLIFKLFFNFSVVGTWVYSFEQEIPDYSATYDEASPDSIPMQNVKINNYYTFEDNGVATFRVGTLTYYGEYSLGTDEKGANSITLYLPDVANGTFTYSVTGNAITGRKLTLSYVDPYTGKPNDTEFESSVYTEPKIERDDEFKPNEKLTGKWIYDDGFNTMTYSLNEDGTVVIDSNIQDTHNQLKGIYSCDDKEIKITYMNVIEMDFSYDYRFEGDTLYIGDTPLIKDTGSTKDQAK